MVLVASICFTLSSEHPSPPQKSHKVNRRNLRSVVCTVQLARPLMAAGATKGYVKCNPIDVVTLLMRGWPQAEAGNALSI